MREPDLEGACGLAKFRRLFPRLEVGRLRLEREGDQLVEIVRRSDVGGQAEEDDAEPTGGSCFKPDDVDGLSSTAS